ncbi:MAG: hypothetical protein AAF770_01725 [Bacteroidota bacterium]
MLLLLLIKRLLVFKLKLHYLSGWILRMIFFFSSLSFHAATWQAAPSARDIEKSLEGSNPANSKSKIKKITFSLLTGTCILACAWFVQSRWQGSLASDEDTVPADDSVTDSNKLADQTDQSKKVPTKKASKPIRQFSREELLGKRTGYLPNLAIGNEPTASWLPKLIIKKEEGLVEKIEEELTAFFGKPDSYGVLQSGTKRKILQKLKSNKFIKEVVHEFQDLIMKRISIPQADLDKWYYQKKFTKKQFSAILEKDIIAIIEEEGFEYPNSVTQDGKTVQYSTNFANKYIGGDLHDTFAQEEALMLLSLFVLMKKSLSTHEQHLAMNEIAILENLPLFGEFDAGKVYQQRSGRIQKMLEFVKPVDITRHIHLLCIDGPDSRRLQHQPYSVQEMTHLMNKLLISGFAVVESNKNEDKVSHVMIERGNWTGGAFKGNLIVVYLLTFMITTTLNIHYQGSGAPLLKMRLHPMDLGLDKAKKALDLLVEGLSQVGEEEFTMADFWNLIKDIADKKQEEVLASSVYQQARKEKKDFKKMEYSLLTAEQCSHGV